MKSSFVGTFWLGLLLVILSSCVGTTSGNKGQMPLFAIPLQEAEWIRNGEPLEFEGEKWAPQDSVEILLDAEVALVGEYKGVQVFIERVDVRPYDTLYTKFGKNKFRIFKKPLHNDQR